MENDVMMVIPSQSMMHIGPRKPIDASPLPIFNSCKEELRSLTVADLVVILSYLNTAYNNDQAKSHAITTVKIWHPDVFEDVLLKGPPKRTVFRSWPPSSIPLPFELDCSGKMTPNGLSWGATIFDFYTVRLPLPGPPIPTRNVFSGSQLLEWSKTNGRETLAKDEIEWAKGEEEPCLLEPPAPGLFVSKQEENIRARKEGWGISMPRDAVLNSIDLATNNPSKYPSPWPLVPFSYPTEHLRTRIALHQLPKKIIVHDPWNLLAMNSRNRYGRSHTESSIAVVDWVEKTDIVHTYSLQLSSAGEARLQEELLEAKSKDVAVAPAPKNIENREGPEGMDGYCLQAHSDTPPGPIPPPIFVVHDPPPTLQSNAPANSDDNSVTIDEAHLYLSPAHKIGTGNHSIVYQGEWELPRTMFLPPPPTSPVLCKECVEADMESILVEEDGKNGERMEARWREKSAVLRRIVDETKPSTAVRFAYDKGLDVQGNKVSDTIYTVEPQRTTYRVKFEGPVRPIRTRVEWQDPSKPTCRHLLSDLHVPPTVKVGAVAKLSKKHDYHLEREARNYQNFDQHMFEHWSGFNLADASSMHVCPVGALVPQFYGYYVPDLKEDEEEGTTCPETEGQEPQSKAKRGYSSPILLLEDCGQCINVGDLSVDEKHEVSSLVRRFHKAGWVHQSVAERNILVQPGPITVPSTHRIMAEGGQGATERNFRLIDFGRSCTPGRRPGEWERHRVYDEWALQKMFPGL